MSAIPVAPLQSSRSVMREYFECVLCSILFTRGVYPSEDFEVSQWKDGFMVTAVNDELRDFMHKFMEQVHAWMNSGEIIKVILVVRLKETMESMERWEFRISDAHPDNAQSLSGKDVFLELQTLLRQIRSTVGFLPPLEEPCMFDVLAATKPTVAVPDNWKPTVLDTMGNKTESCPLRSITTDKLQIQNKVIYRA
ncbi:DNA-binding protein [Radiomyces spectabilis]|uniref:DNA-binding protein n=1 Tax=Radiomyces spectabilis TaxID=64574 RepID=UPI00221F065A|nr:DNA-binding protein [Radiomyces spectabilis]KAI8365269.1 DNA-binding protein [Radiomyces spectabilis]